MRAQVAVVSHDAGGAEILSSWLLRDPRPHSLVLGGPAKVIFERKLPGSRSISLGEAIASSDWLLCGSSWKAPLERQAIVEAQLGGKKVVVFLDHWSNYRRRLSSGDTLLKPDEIWVADIWAEALAKECFPGCLVVRHSNPYFLDMKDALGKTVPRPRRDKESCAILYVCEPTGERSLREYGDARFLTGYTERDALEFFLAHLHLLGGRRPLITLRPHPSEDPGKYDWVHGHTNVAIVRGGEVALVQEIVEADWVVGCSSMALVVGLLAKKRVVSSIPPGGKRSSLPYPEIEYLQGLVQGQENINSG